MRAASFQPKYTFEMDDDLIKVVRLQYSAGIVTVSVAYSKDGHGIIERNATKIQCAGQPSVQPGKLGLWLHYRWRPILPLPWLSIRRKRFF